MQLYRVALPTIDDSVDFFDMSIDLSTASITCVFKWLDGVWRMFAYLPSGEIREAGVFPNSVNWKGFSDYMVIFLIDKANIGKTDLVSCVMLLLDLQAL